jgi:hypothetical protein
MTMFRSFAQVSPISDETSDLVSEVRDEVIPAAPDVVTTDFLEKHDIYSRGRFGMWKYEVSNTDHSLMQGVELINRLLLGEPEHGGEIAA